MKRLIPVIALAALFTSWSVSQAEAAEATAAIDFNSSYVWRGLTFNDGLVVQPSVEVGTNGFTFNVWANMDIDDYGDTLDAGEFSEVDLTVSYTFELGPVETSVGAIEYLFPAGGDSTSELFVTTGMDIGAGFSASIELYYDFDQVDDFYAVIGAGYAYDINEALALELGASISVAGEDFAVAYGAGTEAGLFNYNLSASLNYAVTKEFSAGININFTDTLNEDVLADTSVDQKVYGGLSLSYSF